MSKSVVIMGALGRMGSTLVGMVENDANFKLAGAVVLESQLKDAKSLPCLVSSDIKEILAKLDDEPIIIDFTAPKTSLSVAKAAAEKKACHIIGTTGFTEEEMKELKKLAKETKIFWAPNMSVGVNVLLKILPELTRLLGDKYDVEMVEIHHNKKVDSPSGTAVRMAEVLAEAKNWKLSDVGCFHREGIIGARPHDEIGVQTLRGGDVVGDHTVYYLGYGERIEVKHQAQSRENFAQGAFRVARWLPDQKAGQLYTMADLLQ